ncbi:tryptophan halogenase family protein [Thetidibacter halocola]|uniref:Tryptophan 7-halogenase n=1 Tax=Thetidibacter halocola TaxID=2827239 RepID=A0A8J7WFQ6_9RHOB|nr:tryptophan halogenase family protein [Thetidibacter halocola]MBS0126835.1 tryptophan 7-halogenase [Thetidibacter halocola]
MTPNAIRNILILGGGSSGWLAALYLKRFLRHVPVKITLVESAQIGTIGVGEATIPSMVRYIRQLGLDEAEFMRRCKATYKLGIRFDDWLEPGHGYWHPFGLAGGRIDGIDLFHFWLRKRLVTADPRPYASFSLQARAMEAGRAPRSVSQGSPMIDTGSYAFHVDAGAMAEYLRELAIKDGVKHIFDEVTQVHHDETGNVAALDTVGGRHLEADLFIDCTGFAGVLIEKAMGDPWVDLSDQLLCDRAVVLPQQKDEEMPPFTRSSAQEAGWIWQIPLSHRKGSGYVYSSAHLDDTAAADRLLKLAGFRRARAADPRFLKMRVGHRTEFWKGNVVSMGLSSGFIEPLESTGLYFVHRALDLLRDGFPDRAMAPALRRAFNRQMGETYAEVRDFIVLHYVASRREDTDFWRAARSVPLPDSLAEALDGYDEHGQLALRHEACFAEANYFFILAGNNRLPRRPTARATAVDFKRVASILDQIDAQTDTVIESLPGHRVYSDWLHSQPLEDDWPVDEGAAVGVGVTSD